MAIRTVLFDHDDTLLPTFALRARVLSEAARAVLGRELDGAAVMAAADGRNLEQMSEDLTDGDAPLACELVADYRQRYYLANQQGLVPYAGVPELLAELRARKIRVAVVTSKLGSGAREELQRTGLALYIEHLIGAEDVAQHKPAPQPFYQVLAALGEEPSSAMMIGDTSADVLGAKAAGVLSVAALWGTRDRQALLSHRPDHAVESPRDVLALL